MGYGTPVVVGLSGLFRKGGVNLLLGRGGAGKTTLFLSLAGFLPLLSGRVRVDGAPWEPEGRICLSFQNPETLFFCPTVGEEITFSLTERGISLSDAESQGKSWLERWGIDPETVWSRNPFQLSGGEKRRVALAACTVFRPELVLLDEPLAGLDLPGQVSLLEIIREMAAERVVIIVTHDPELLLKIAGTVLVLHDGGGEWFEGGKPFLSRAVTEPGFFPLPEWYLAAVGKADPEIGLPWPTGEETARFVMGTSPTTGRMCPTSQDGEILEGTSPKGEGIL